MVGNLPAALHLNHRDVTRRQQMFGLAGLTLGEHPGVLQQPDFIGRQLIALGGQPTHRVQGRQIIHDTEVAHDELGH